MKILNIFVIAIAYIGLTWSAATNTTLSDYEIEHIDAIDSYLADCTVLLRSNGDFPLKFYEKDIHLYGNGVRNTIKGGTGSGDVRSHYFENIEDAFINEGYNILTKDFLDQYDVVYENAHKKFIEDLNKPFSDPMTAMFATMGATMKEPEYDIPYSKKGNIAIYVLSRISGEGTDRTVETGDVLLTNTETEMIKTLASGYRKFMLVLNTGGPVDLSGLDKVKNILLLSQLRVNTSKTLVQIINGKKYPSGKLATTWTKVSDYPKIGGFGEGTDTDYKEGIYVGYRYFDSADVNVMFPFGFGLGYTNFAHLIKGVKLVGEEFHVDVDVINVGLYKGKEVIQLYLSKPNTTLDEPYQILVAYEKTQELKPGRIETLHLKFKFSDFASYHTEKAAYILDKGCYTIRLGNSSRDTKPCGKVTIKSMITVKQLKNKLGKPSFKDYSVVSKKKDSLFDMIFVPKFTLNASSIEKVVEKYDKTYSVPKEVKALTTEEKAKLVVGDLDDPAGIVAKYSVAGEAGRTHPATGVRPLIMADGPAGLRIAKDYYIDDNGAAHSTEFSFASMAINLSDEFLAMLKAMFPPPSDDVEILHQYATAIPIGTAIAQSWNKEFAEKCGDIVGSEMEMFHVQLWLAPALNIHRSILCGRNFEYYSEDPLITGLTAANIIKGVQKHKNAFVTMKHFAANNQETNRNGNSSNASERALREIYLKGFEIAVKEANPKAVMCSYNLINGVRTNESKELINDILRNEFDFNGIVMTDWEVGAYSEKYPLPQPSNVVKATGNIFMPGSEDNYLQIMESIENKSLSMKDLEISASMIYNLAKEVEKAEKEN